MTHRLAVLACLSSSLVFAQTVPGSVSFNARLTDTAGAPVTGSHTLGFGLYDSSSGGAALWTENVASATFSAEGLTFVELGSVTPLSPAALDGRKLYLEVSVDGTTMSPRLAIVSVPYAIRASVAASALTIGSLTENQLQKRISGMCNAGQAVRTIDAQGGVTCENISVGGGGDVTAVTTAAGSGLTGGATSGDIALGLASCANGEVLKSDGTGWACSAPTTVAASSGLSVNGGNVGLQPCAAGEVLKSNGTGWACSPDTAGGGGGRNLISWGSDLAKWTRDPASTNRTIVINTAEVVEGDSSFTFSSTTIAEPGVIAWYGPEYIPVDTSRVYEGRIAAKALAGSTIGTNFTGFFSAGFLAYDKNKAPLAGNGGVNAPTVGGVKCSTFIADGVAHTAFNTTSWNRYAQLVTGEGTGLNQFPVGTRFIRPCVGANIVGVGSTVVDSFTLFERDRYVSAWTPVTQNNTYYTFTHNLGVMPKRCEAYWSTSASGTPKRRLPEFANNCHANGLTDGWRGGEIVVTATAASLYAYAGGNMFCYYEGSWVGYTSAYVQMICDL